MALLSASITPTNLVTTSGAATLTNKTLTGAIMNGTLGATTPSTVVATTVKASTTMGVGAATPSASGAGITFPASQSDSSDANTLDDYEEGTWTPAVAGSTAGTFLALSGRYTKIGRIVTCDFFLQLSGFTYTNNNAAFTVTGLPFVPTSFSYVGPTGSMWSQAFNFNNTESAGVDFVTPATTSSSTILFKTSGTGASSGNVINNNNANPILTGQVVYSV